MDNNIEVCGAASYTNVKGLERAENKPLSQIINTPFYVRNTRIKRDFNLPSLVKKIAKSSMRTLNKINEQINPLADMMLESTNQSQRLKRWHTLDLIFRVQ